MYCLLHPEDYGSKVGDTNKEKEEDDEEEEEEEDNEEEQEEEEEDNEDEIESFPKNLVPLLAFNSSLQLTI